MGKSVAGDVIILPFPQTDLKPGKLRPALALVGLPGDDLILCQITSQARHDGFSLALGPADFISGGLPVSSFIRPNRLFTVEQSVVVRVAGRVKTDKLQEVLAAARRILT
jgi:mRNA interferase MazF